MLKKVSSGLLALILVALVGLSSAQEKVIIDADMGQLNDDALVMFMLAQADDVEVLGVTIVPGNTWTEEGVAYTLRQLELIGREDIPVVPGVGEPLMGSRQDWLDAEQRLWGNVEYMGAYSRPRPPSHTELASEPYRGYATTEPSDEHAVDFIIRSVRENPNEVTLFVLGPPTNIALAVRKDPGIVPLVKSVIYMGGSFDIPGNTNPVSEFNWWFDPEATYISVRTPFPEQIVVPLDIAERVYYTREQYERIAAGPDESGIVQMYRDRHGPRFENNPDSESFVWDALTAAIFLDPSIATVMEDRYIDIDVNYGPNYGKSIGYHESRNRSLDNPENYPAGTQRVSILFDIDREAFWDLLVDLMTRPTAAMQEQE